LLIFFKIKYKDLGLKTKKQLDSRLLDDFLVD